LKLTSRVTNDSGSDRHVVLTATIPEELSAEVCVDILESPEFTVANGTRYPSTISITSSKSQTHLPLTVAASEVTNSGGVGLKSSVIKSTEVVYPGAKQDQSLGGTLSETKPVEFEFTLPEGYVPGSAELRFEMHLAPISSIEAALDALIREPCGCFEQTSVTVFPLLMVHRYLKHSYPENVIREKVLDVKARIERGYERMIKYETPTGGYEWFGSSPGHESLTAFGLTILRAIEKEVFELEEDSERVQRAMQWLKGRAKGDHKGFQLSNRAMDTFGRASQKVSDAYIIWALINIGGVNLAKDLDFVIKIALTSNSPYIIALVADAAFKHGRGDNGTILNEQLKKFQLADGSLSGATESITKSTGLMLKLESTALAVLAWLNQPEKQPKNIEQAVNFIIGSVKGGLYGSTQSTVLCLMALIEYQKYARSSLSELLVNFSLGDLEETPLGVSTDPNSRSQLVDYLSSYDVTEYLSSLQPGNKVSLAVSLPSNSSPSLKLPFSLSLFYKDTNPPTPPETSLQLSYTPSTTTPKVGDVIKYGVSVKNMADGEVGMVVLLLSFGAGVEVNFERLDLLVDSGVIGYYEVIGRQVVVYLRGMAGLQSVNFDVDFDVKFNGRFQVDPSRGYLYYGEDFVWTSSWMLVVGEDN